MRCTIARDLANHRREIVRMAEAERDAALCTKLHKGIFCRVVIIMEAEPAVPVSNA